jgi:hypothetical protein
MTDAGRLDCSFHFEGRFRIYGARSVALERPEINDFFEILPPTSPL